MISCAILFAILSLHRPEWLILSILSFTEFVLTHALDSNGHMLYVLIPIATSAAGGALCLKRSKLGYYQAAILAVTLFAYASLAYDVSLGKNFLIYNNYEAVIYGLVCCQFIVAFPAIRAIRGNITSSSFTMLFNLQRGFRV